MTCPAGPSCWALDTPDGPCPAGPSCWALDTAHRPRTTLPNPGDCELIVHAALKNHDMPAVVLALKLLAVQNPHRAQALYDLVLLAIKINPYNTETPQGAAHGQ